jgi:hypothetical protein
MDSREPKQDNGSLSVCCRRARCARCRRQPTISSPSRSLHFGLPTLVLILVYSCCTSSAGQAAATVPQSERVLAGHRRGAQLTNAATWPSSRFLVGERSSHSLPGHTRTTRAAGKGSDEIINVRYTHISCMVVGGPQQRAMAAAHSRQAGCGTTHGAHHPTLLPLPTHL